MTTGNYLSTLCMGILLLFSLNGALATEPSDTSVATIPTTIQSNASYQVGPGDVLEISVWQEEDLVKDVMIPPDGVISFPLAGSLDVKGKTIDQISQNLTERLEAVIVDPIVTVVLQSYESNKIFVLGKVTKPGEFPAAGPITVMQALAMAGGMAKFADTDNINIIRNQNGDMVAIPFNFSEVSEGNKLDQNIVLQKGDVVVVP